MRERKEGSEGWRERGRGRGRGREGRGRVEYNKFLRDITKRSGQKRTIVCLEQLDGIIMGYRKSQMGRQSRASNPLAGRT
jgi:hypothetical protein